MTGTSTNLAGYLYPTAVSWGYPHLEVLALTANTSYSVYRKFRPSNATSNDDWYPHGSDLELVGGAVPNASFSVAVRSRTGGENVTDLYHTGAGGTLYEKSHGDDEFWSGFSGADGPDWWQPLTHSANAVSGVAVAAYEEVQDDLYVLAKGAHNSTIHNVRRTNGVWGPYNDLGGADMRHTPAAVSWDGTRVDVFGIGSANNHLLHTYAADGTTWATFNGGASEFEDLGGFCTTSPVVSSRAKGLLDVFARGGDGGLWHLAYNGTWAPWTLISGNVTIQGQPDALSWDANRIDLFAWGSDNSLLTKSYDAQTNQWTPSDGFDQIGKGLSGPPKSVSDAEGSMHVFVYLLYGGVGWKSWNTSAGSTWLSGDFVNLGTPIF
jgi:hypothetical protein